MDEIDELLALVGPGFHTNTQVRATLGGHVLEFALDITTMGSAGPERPNSHAEAYAEIARAFNDLYTKLMSHERWTARDDPDVRVRFVETEPARWQLNGTLVRRASYCVQGEGSIILVRTSRDRSSNG